MLAMWQLQELRQFNAPEARALTLYLDLSCSKKRSHALKKALALVAKALERAGLDPQIGLTELAEDLELVRIYLTTSAGQRCRGIAFFSCAQELFWRAIPLQRPLGDSASVGTQFDLAPLQALLAEQKQPALPL